MNSYFEERSCHQYWTAKLSDDLDIFSLIFNIRNFAVFEARPDTSIPLQALLRELASQHSWKHTYTR